MKTAIQVPPAPRREQGFALILVLTISALVVLMVLALVSLSTNQTRMFRAERDRSIAQANAALSLKIALGELQLQLGPDTRISAPGDIIPGAQQRYITGAWNSWKLDPASAPNYDQEKQRRFRKWMVSGIPEDQARQQSYAATAPSPSGSDAVQLVGKGSVGETTGSDKHLWVRKSPIREPKNNGRDAGSSAFIVMDEGIKARFNLPATNTATLTHTAARMGVVGAPSRNAIEKANDALQPFGNTAAARAALRNASNLETLALAAGGSPAAVQPFSHDLTAHSAAVLSDAANGGLKKDLNSLFEQNTLPADFQSRRLYSNTNSGYGGSPADPPWSLLFNHNRLSRQARSVGGADGFITSTTLAGFNAGQTDFSGNVSVNLTTPQTGQPISPVIARCELLFSAFVKQTHSNWVNSVPNAFASAGTGWNYMIHLVYQPVITLWNPYNVPLQLDNARIEIDSPPIGFKFFRTTGTAGVTGQINSTHVPFSQLYVNAGDRRTKRFLLSLYNELSGTTPTNPSVVLLPGEVKIFSPYVPPTFTWNSRIQLEGGGSVSLFDYQNQQIQQLPAVPGWRGPQFGFSIDWLNPTHSGYYDSGARRNGPNGQLGVIGSRLSDTFDIEIMPMAQLEAGTNLRSYGVNLASSSGQILSRLEFDYGGDSTTLVNAVTQSNRATSAPVTFPLRMTSYTEPLYGAKHVVNRDAQLRNVVVLPFLSISAQGKTTMDATFPNRPWIHGNLGRPIVRVDMTREQQAWQSHELAVRPINGSSDTSISLDFDNTGRSYFVSGLRRDTGSEFGITREAPLMPIQSVAQLAQVNLSSTVAQLPNVDHAVGQSFAHPLIPTARTTNRASGMNYDFLDHSYLANLSLWDSWYASTLGQYGGTRAFSGVASRTPQKVAEDFFKSGQPLLNPRLSPWFGRGGGPDEAVKALTAGSTMTADAHTKAAAFQMMLGSLNVNSTSKEAWKALLASMNADPALLLASADGNTSRTFRYNTTSLASTTNFFSKFRLTNNTPFTRPGTATAPTGDQRWQVLQGGRELTDQELDVLAEQIVVEVKRRGPFLSMAEFVNRRLGSTANTTTSTPTTPGAADRLFLTGALQNAIEESGINNKSPLTRFNRDIRTSDISTARYASTAAALGPTNTGSAGVLDQLAILTKIGASLNARSDTFRIRFYGDVKDPTNRVVSRAYGEAVVQRVPDYIDPSDAAHIAPAALTSTANKYFGRRFNVISMRWLTPDEI